MNVVQRLFGLGLVLGVLTGCPGGGGGGGGGDDAGVAAPVVGEWKIKNKDGKLTGQAAKIEADHIRIKTPNMDLSEGAASFSKEGDQLVAQWYGSKYEFTVNDDGTVVMEGSGMYYHLVPPGQADGGDGEGDASGDGGEAAGDEGGE